MNFETFKMFREFGCEFVNQLMLPNDLSTGEIEAKFGERGPLGNTFYYFYFSKVKVMAQRVQLGERNKKS